MPPLPHTRQLIATSWTVWRWHSSGRACGASADCAPPHTHKAYRGHQQLCLEGLLPPLEMELNAVAALNVPQQAACSTDPSVSVLEAHMANRDFSEGFFIRPYLTAHTAPSSASCKPPSAPASTAPRLHTHSTCPRLHPGTHRELSCTSTWGGSLSTRVVTSSCHPCMRGGG